MEGRVRSQFQRAWVEWSLLAAILLAALAVRLLALDCFLTIDEQLWALRAVHFYQALHTGDLAATYQAQHPGVTTMWLGAASIELGLVSTTDSLARIAFASRWLAALLNWAGLCLMCLLLVRLFDRRVALVATLLIGFDPFYLAHSRLLHLDGLLTTFSTLCLLALLCFLAEGKGWAALLAAAGAALAILTKSPGLLLLPFGALLVGLHSLTRQRTWGQRLLHAVGGALLWCLAVCALVFALWPALWVAPGATLIQLWRGISGQGLSPHENLNFFLGQPTQVPGPSFYPVAYLFRATPWTLLGLVISLPLLIPSFPLAPSLRREQRVQLYVLCGFVLLFSTFMSLGAKKFDRYLLPIFPALDLLAALGLTVLGRAVAGRREALLGAGFGLLMVTQVALTLAHYPYYLSYYNPLAGGARRAVRTLLVGWGEGMERAAAYLNAKPDGAKLRVTAWYEPTLAPFFRGRTSLLYEADYTTDYFIFYINERQRDMSRARRYCLPGGPEKVIRAKGIDYAWICSTDEARQPLVSYLRERVEPGDLILLSQPAPRLVAKLPAQALSIAPETDPYTALRELSRVTNGHRRLWYIREPYEPRALRVVDQQLAVHCHRLDTVDLPLARVILYSLPPATPFAVIEPSQPLNVAFGEGLLLRGMGLADSEVDFRRAVGVTLHWQSLTRSKCDLKIAWRLEDGMGHLWGGVDEPLRDAEGLRTSDWAPGSEHVSRHLVPLIAGLPPGPYYLKLILYCEEDMRQLPFRQSGGNWQQLPYPLATIRVVPAPFPPRIEELAIPQRKEVALREGLKLLGLTPPNSPLRPGERISFELFWEATAERRGDYRLRLELESATGQVVASLEVPPAGADYPTGRWPVGERVRQRYELLVPAITPPGTYELSVRLMDADGRPVGSERIYLTEVAVQGRAHRFTAPEISHEQRASLGGVVDLLGYDLAETELSPGDEVELTLYWRARKEMTTSYTVFTHLLDGANHIWGQKDSVPGDGAWPTTGWVAGEVVIDRYCFQVQKDAPPGEYHLEVGMYDAATGQRLSAFGPDGERLPDDRILLSIPIEIR